MHELPSIQPWSLLIELPLTPSTLSVAVTSTDLHISQRAEPDDAVCRAMAQYASQQKRTRRRQLQTSMALTWRAAPLLSRLTSEPPLFPMYLPYHTPCSNHYPPQGLLQRCANIILPYESLLNFVTERFAMGCLCWSDLNGRMQASHSAQAEVSAASLASAEVALLLMQVCVGVLGITIFRRRLRGALQCPAVSVLGSKFRCTMSPETWHLGFRLPQCLFKPANLHFWRHISEQAIPRTMREAIKRSKSACQSLGGSLPRNQAGHP